MNHKSLHDELTVKRLVDRIFADVTELRRINFKQPMSAGLNLGIAGSAEGNLPRYPMPDPATGRQLVLVGCAAPFDQSVPADESQWRGRWEFRPGAFGRAIRTQGVALHLMHDPSITIATTMDRSLSVWEGGDGLMFRMNPPHSLTGREVLRHARNKAFVGASIGFRPNASTADTAGDLSSFTVVAMHEISLVVAGALPRFRSTWVDVMSELDSWRLEDSAFADIVVKETQRVSYGDRSWEFTAGGTYRIPVILASLLINTGVATKARRDL